MQEPKGEPRKEVAVAPATGEEPAGPAVAGAPKRLPPQRSLYPLLALKEVGSVAEI